MRSLSGSWRPARTLSSSEKDEGKAIAHTHTRARDARPYLLALTQSHVCLFSLSSHTTTGTPLARSNSSGSTSGREAGGRGESDAEFERFMEARADSLFLKSLLFWVLGPLPMLCFSLFRLDADLSSGRYLMAITMVFGVSCAWLHHRGHMSPRTGAIATCIHSLVVQSIGQAMTGGINLGSPMVIGPGMITCQV